MKKVLKLFVAIILAIVILGGVMFLIDCSRGKSGKTPMFAVEKYVLKDGGTTYYQGLGYSIEGYNTFTGGITAEIGPWKIELQEAKEIICDYDKNTNVEDESIINDNNESGEIENIVSGDSITSGDNELSGDVVLSGDVEISGDDIKATPESGDENIVEISGDTEVKEDEYSFIATIIGVNGKNLVVTPLEDEEINKSADMISFSLKNGLENEEYLIGQKVKIQYTGVVAESYPAQIDVISIEKIN